MKFNQFKDGSCDINFSKEEIKIINKYKKVHFTAEGLRHFGNSLMKMVVEFNTKFSEDVKNLQTEFKEK
tara:strand:+ start:3127 stop:3333 length:207 start_codon:yes stop_codon:yes gene_type:complete